MSLMHSPLGLIEALEDELMQQHRERERARRRR